MVFSNFDIDIHNIQLILYYGEGEGYADRLSQFKVKRLWLIDRYEFVTFSKEKV